MLLWFFFFKQKTAYEMRISDWSSDVCSSDLMTALAERHGADGWRVTSSGLRWRRIAGNGSGAHPGPADRVTVHYVGTFADGPAFDSSVARGETATFPLHRVIDGWAVGDQPLGGGHKVALQRSEKRRVGKHG